MSSWASLTVTQLKQVLQSHDLGADLFKSSKTRKAHLIAACEDGLNDADLETALYKYLPASQTTDNLKGGVLAPRNSRLELLAQSPTNSPEKENPVPSRPRSRGPRARTPSRARSRTPRATTPGRAALREMSYGAKANAAAHYAPEDEEDQTETSPIGGGTRVKGIDSVTASQIARQEFIRRRKERMSLPAEARSTYSPTGRTPPHAAAGDGHNNSSSFKEPVMSLGTADRSPGNSHGDLLKKSSKLAFANYNDHQDPPIGKGAENMGERRWSNTAVHSLGGSAQDYHRHTDRYSVSGRDVQSTRDGSRTPPRTAVADVRERTDIQHQQYKSEERGRSQSRKSIDLRQSSEQELGSSGGVSSGGVSDGIAPFSTRGAVPMDPAGRPVVWRISSPPKLGPTLATREAPKRMPSFGSRRDSSTGGGESHRNVKQSRHSVVDRYYHRHNDSDDDGDDDPVQVVQGGSSMAAADRQPHARHKRSTIGSSTAGGGRMSSEGLSDNRVALDSDGDEQVTSKGHRKTRSKSKGRSYLSVAGTTGGRGVFAMENVAPVLMTVFKICTASAVLAGIFIGLRSTGIFKSVVYCSNTGEAKMLDCISCPHNAECSGGAMDCVKKFRREWYNGMWTCVRDTKSYEVAQRYLYAVSEHLARLEGQRACGYPVQSVLSKEDLLVYLQSRKDAADRNSFDTRVGILFDELLPAAVELAGVEVGRAQPSGVHTIRRLHNANGEYLYQSAMTMKPLTCRAQEFLMKFLGIGIVVSAVVVCAVYWYVTRSRAASMREAVLRVIEKHTELTADNYSSGPKINEIVAILKREQDYADVARHVDEKKIREICLSLVRGRAGIATTSFVHDTAPLYYSTRVVDSLVAKKNAKSVAS